MSVVLAARARVAPLVACLALAPLALHAQSVTGDSLFRAERWGLARPALEQAVRHDPQDARAWQELGRVSFLAHDLRGAERALERATALAPNESRTHDWLALTYAAEVPSAGKLRQFSLGRKMHEHFARAVALDPLDGQSQLDWIRFRLLAPGLVGGDRDAARASADSLLMRDAYHGHLARAFIADKSQDAPSAEREFLAARALAPDSAVPAYQLAYLYEHQQRWRDAFAALDAFRARRPDARATDAELGRAAALSGQELARGREALERYLGAGDDTAGPTLADARSWLAAIDARAEQHGNVTLDAEQRASHRRA